MRIATLNSSQDAFGGIARRQADQARIQNQLGTGLRINSPGDDPVGAAQAELARSRLTRLAQDERATSLSSSLLSTAEGALGQGVDLLQSVRESLVAAGNGAYSDSDRKALALELRSARDQMLSIANTSDGAGGYVFAGQGALTEPVSGGSVLSWDPMAGDQRVGEGGRYATTVDGRASFMTLPQGNGVFTTASAAGNTGTGWIDAGSVANAMQLTGHNYQITLGGAPGALTYTVVDTDAGTTLASNVALPANGRIDIDGQRVTIGGTPSPADSFSLAPAGQQSVFDTLDRAIALLEQPTTKAGYAEGLSRVQADVDRALDALSMTRSRVGEELKRVDNATAAGEQQEISVTARRSAIEDLDFAQAISELQNNQTGLEAALKAYSTVSRTNLFQLLS
jgi:flagellar hook-associated protein 3 FlgL